MKKAKKFLALLLVLVLAFALCVPAFADSSTQKKTFNYVSFGASNTMGYGLHGFLPVELYNDPSVCYDNREGSAVAKDGYFTSGYVFYPDNCYPQLVKESLQKTLGNDYDVVLNQCAINSMRAYDLRYILDDDQPADAYVRWRLGDGSVDSGWIYDIERERNQTVTVAGAEYNYSKDKTDIRAEFKQAVIDADLITYDLGVNDFGVYLANRLADNNYDADFANIVGEENADIFYSVREELRKVVISLVGDDIDENTFEEIDFYLDTLAYAYTGFVVSFDEAMKIIYGLNPDVDVVVVSIQNLLDGIELDLGGVVLPLGELFGAVLNLANTYTSILSPYASKYSYADVRQNGHVDFFADELLAWDGDPATLSQNMKDCFDAYDSAFLTSNKVKDRVNAYCNANGILIGSEQYNEILETARSVAYYGMAQAALTGLKQNTLVIDDLNLGQFNGQVRKIAYEQAVDKVLNGEDYETILSETKDAVNKLICTDTGKSNVHLFMVAGYANCFFYHPTPKGHVQLKDAVLNAYYGGISGRRALISAIGGIHQDIVKGTLKLGMKLPIAIVEKAADAFGIDGGAASVLTSFVGSDYFVEMLCGLIGIDDSTKLDKLITCIEQAEASVVGHTHYLTKVEAKSASLFTPGNIEYYVCQQCGKCFSDAEGTQQISQLSTIIPRVSIFSFLMNFFMRFVNGGVFGGISFGK